MQILSPLHSGSVVAWKSLSRCDKVQCNMLGISILYNGATEGVECGFPCFLPDYDAVSMPGKLQKGLSFSPVSPNLGRVTRPHTPHFSALYTPKLHLCTLVLMPGTPFPHTPKPHLGCPILPFGVSHFAIWGIFSAHLRTTYSPDARFGFFVFRSKSMCVFFPFGSSCFFGIRLAG